MKNRMRFFTPSVFFYFTIPIILKFFDWVTTVIGLNLSEVQYTFRDGLMTEYTIIYKVAESNPFMAFFLYRNVWIALAVALLIVSVTQIILWRMHSYANSLIAEGFSKYVTLMPVLANIILISISLRCVLGNLMIILSQ